MDVMVTPYAARLLVPLAVSAWLSMTGCATIGGNLKWIQPGTTTKEDVVARYGEPDLVRTSAEGDIATYRPRPAPRPPVTVRVARPGPEGLITAQTEPVSPGLGVRDIAAGTDERPPYEFHIRYDAQGIVRDVRR